MTISGKHVALSLYDSLFVMQKEGKTMHMLKNAYIKCMCWLYYRFERIVNRLGENEVPKILYEGTVSSYELKLLSILSKAGSDIVLLQYDGDRPYRALDPSNALSFELESAGMGAFPEGFCIRKLQKELERKLLYFCSLVHHHHRYN